MAEPVEIPSNSMPTYSVYRKELLKKGWLPVPQKDGIRSKIPEVVCGASGNLCTAHWMYTKPVDNRQLSFVLWDSERGLIVAPYVDDDR